MSEIAFVTWLGVALAAGAFIGWAARLLFGSGRRRPRSRRPNADASDDMPTVLHLVQEALRGQREIVSGMNELRMLFEVMTRQLQELRSSLTPTHESRALEPALSSRRTDSRAAQEFLDQEFHVSERSVTDTVSEFLTLADSQELARHAVIRFFSDRQRAVSFVIELEGGWAMLAVHTDATGRHALGIPAIRVGMGPVDLRPYFDFREYNGLDPIRASQVVDFARLAKSGTSWIASKKGLIDGTR
jgi:hypothetical protein